MTNEASSVTKDTKGYEVRNAIIPIFQKMPEGPERAAVMEIFKRFNDYIGLQTGGIPAPANETDHQSHVAQLKTAIDFFMAISNILGTLGLITNWKEKPQEMAKAVYERMREDRAKYWRAVSVITEIYTTYTGANKTLFSINALPDEIRIEVVRILKERKLLREE